MLNLLYLVSLFTLTVQSSWNARSDPPECKKSNGHFFGDAEMENRGCCLSELGMRLCNRINVSKENVNEHLKKVESKVLTKNSSCFDAETVLSAPLFGLSAWSNEFFPIDQRDDALQIVQQSFCKPQCCSWKHECKQMYDAIELDVKDSVTSAILKRKIFVGIGCNYGQSSSQNRVLRRAENNIANGATNTPAQTTITTVALTSTPDQTATPMGELPSTTYQNTAATVEVPVTPDQTTTTTVGLHSTSDQTTTTTIAISSSSVQTTTVPPPSSSNQTSTSKVALPSAPDQTVTTTVAPPRAPDQTTTSTTMISSSSDQTTTTTVPPPGSSNQTSLSKVALPSTPDQTVTTTVAPPRAPDQTTTTTTTIPSSSDQTTTATVASPSTSDQSTTTTVAIPSSSAQTTTTTVALPSTSDQSTTTTVAIPSSSDQSTATTVAIPTSSVQTTTTSVAPPRTQDQITTTKAALPSSSVQTTTTKVISTPDLTTSTTVAQTGVPVQPTTTTVAIPFGPDHSTIVETPMSTPKEVLILNTSDKTITTDVAPLPSAKDVLLVNTSNQSSTREVPMSSNFDRTSTKIAAATPGVSPPTSSDLKANNTTLGPDLTLKSASNYFSERSSTSVQNVSLTTSPSTVNQTVTTTTPETNPLSNLTLVSFSNSSTLSVSQTTSQSSSSIETTTTFRQDAVTLSSLPSTINQVSYHPSSSTEMQSPTLTSPKSVSQATQTLVDNQTVTSITLHPTLPSSDQLSTSANLNKDLNISLNTLLRNSSYPDAVNNLSSSVNVSSASIASNQSSQVTKNETKAPVTTKIRLLETPENVPKFESVSNTTSRATILTKAPYPSTTQENSDSQTENENDGEDEDDHSSNSKPGMERLDRLGSIEIQPLSLSFGNRNSSANTTIQPYLQVSQTRPANIPAGYLQKPGVGIVEPFDHNSLGKVSMNPNAAPQYKLKRNRGIITFYRDCVGIPPHDLEDHPCVFPFIYLGKIHTACTTMEDNLPWCATAVDPNHHMVTNDWGYCTASCPIETRTCKTVVGGPIVNVFCRFPFRYKGTQYHTCTTDDDSVGPWCATQVDAHGDYMPDFWGRCECPDSLNMTISGERRELENLEQQGVSEDYDDTENESSEPQILEDDDLKLRKGPLDTSTNEYRNNYEKNRKPQTYGLTTTSGYENIYQSLTQQNSVETGGQTTERFNYQQGADFIGGPPFQGYPTTVASTKASSQKTSFRTQTSTRGYLETIGNNPLILPETTQMPTNYEDNPESYSVSTPSTVRYKPAFTTSAPWYMAIFTTYSPQKSSRGIDNSGLLYPTKVSTSTTKTTTSTTTLSPIRLMTLRQRRPASSKDLPFQGTLATYIPSFLNDTIQEEFLLKYGLNLKAFEPK